MMTRLAHTIDQAGLDGREALCRDMARSAGRLALAGYNRRDAAHIALKGPQDFLTETDGAVEAHLKARIAEGFPEDAFLGEESGGAIGDHVWVVDPIDGTANFARQIPHFCISIAFVADGQIELGAIYNPSLDEFYFARRGRGAEKNGQTIRVADTTDRNAACVELGWSNRVPLATYLAALTDLLEQGANVRRGASGALGLAYVAEGRSDAYAELHMFPWDCLAGLLLVEEAGGVVCPFLSVDGLAVGGSVLAAAPGIAGAVSHATGIAIVPARMDERAVAV
jgi:myo-inositol-1(or 4)-monophosphatase